MKCTHSIHIGFSCRTHWIFFSVAHMLTSHTKISTCGNLAKRLLTQLWISKSSTESQNPDWNTPRLRAGSKQQKLDWIAKARLKHTSPTCGNLIYCFSRAFAQALRAGICYDGAWRNRSLVNVIFAWGSLGDGPFGGLEGCPGANLDGASLKKQ